MSIENFMLKSEGKPFRCKCGCNVFHRPDPADHSRHKCNACEARYISEEIDEPPSPSPPPAATERAGLVDELRDLMAGAWAASDPEIGLVPDVLEIAARHEADYLARLSAAEGQAAHFQRLADTMAEQRDALAAFKAYVHRRLDTAGVPTHPDGPHSAQGCRIGDRLEIVIDGRDRADTATERLRAAEERVRALTAALTAIGNVDGTNWAEHNDMIQKIARVALAALPDAERTAQ